MSVQVIFGQILTYIADQLTVYKRKGKMSLLVRRFRNRKVYNTTQTQSLP